MHAAVIGAGWAGCAAAVTLARLGHRVTLYETASIAGGRARRVPRAGLAIDNGQHLLLGAYVQTRNMLAVVHGGNGEAGLRRSPLAIEPFVREPSALHLRARRLPAPFGLLAGLVTANGLTFRERLGVVAWFRRLARARFRCPADATVADLLATGPEQAARVLWAPLCLAALNTPPERASAQVFANVLRAAFASDSRASDFLLPATDLSALFPDAALRFVESRGGRVALRTRARLAGAGDATVVVSEGREIATFDAAVVAVASHQVDDTLPAHPAFRDTLAAAQCLAYEPLATVWLGYATRGPLFAPLARLDDAPGQWIVDRSDVLAGATADPSRPRLAQLVAVVISAQGPHEKLPAPAIATACHAQLRRLVPGWPELAWSQTIDEQRATYACTPGRRHPLSAHPHPRVAFAGDWLDPEFPATLEAAVRTGVAAAVALDGQGDRQWAQGRAAVSSGRYG